MPPPSPKAQTEDLTAAALEALSLADTIPFPATTPIPPPIHPTTHLEGLPANIPLPPTTHPRSSHAQHLLRTVTSYLHRSLHNPSSTTSSLLPLRAITALALSTPSYRRLLAHLGIIRILAPAFPQHAESSPTTAIEIAQCLSACLRGADALAIAHFSACRATRQVLRGWALLPAPIPASFANHLCAIFLPVLSALPPTALEVLAAPESLGLFRMALHQSMAENAPRTITALLRVLSAVVVHATDAIEPSTAPDPPPVKRSAVQARVREAGLIDLSLLLMHDLPRNHAVQQAALKLLAAVTERNVQNIVAVGTARNADALRLVLRAAPVRNSLLAPAPRPSSPHDDSRRIEILCTLCDLVSELSRVRNNFDALLALGLTSVLVEILDTVVLSLCHVRKALDLLERAVRSAEAEGRKAYAQFAASAVVTSMQAFRHNPGVQQAGIRVLVALMLSFDRNRESACEVYAVQAVHFAVTEHSKDAGVMAVSCVFLLQLSPLHIMRSNLVISELKKVVRARLKIHKEDTETAAVIENLARALELVPQRTIRSIEEFLTMSNTEKNSVLSGGGTPNKRLLSNRSPLVTGSFRKSFHRRARQNRGTDDNAYRRRRVRSDFAAETTFERNRSDSGDPGLQDGPRSLKVRNSKFQNISPWMESKDGWASNITDDLDGERSPDDPRACDTLMEMLASSRETADEPSSLSSSRSSGGKVLPSRTDRLPNDSQAPPTPPKFNIHASERKPILVVRSGKHREIDGGREMQTIVEKRGSPISFARGKGEVMHINTMDIDALDSTSGKSEMDVGEEDSLFSLSDSDMGSFDDETWETDDGYPHNYSRNVVDDEVQEEGTDANCSGDTSHFFEGATMNEHTTKSSSGQGSESERSSVEDNAARMVLDVDEHFAELEEGNTDDSTDSQNVVSMMTDPLSNGNEFTEAGGSELLPKSLKYGERERIRSDTTRNSGSWSKIGLWPNNWANTDVHRTSPLPRGNARGESGSITTRRKTTL